MHICVPLILTFIATINGNQLLIEVDDDNSIPDPGKAAKMARFIVHNVDWVAIASISINPKTQSYPFVSLESVSDGFKDNSTGILYFYTAVFDFLSADVTADNRVSVMASLMETDYCAQKYLDPEDPRCARVMMTGRFLKIDNTTAEYKYAKDCFLDRHPAIKYWPVDHNWFYSKFDVKDIYLFDAFGGAKEVNVKDYYNANIAKHKFMY